MFIFSLTSGSDFRKIFLCKNILPSSTNNVYCSWPYPRHWYKQDKEYTLSHDILKTQHYTSLNSLRPSYAYICVSKTIIIVSDNGLSPARRQAIIWTNDGILLIGHLGTHTSVKLYSKCKYLYWRKYAWTCRLRNVVNFVSVSLYWEWLYIIDLCEWFPVGQRWQKLLKWSLMPSSFILLIYILYPFSCFQICSCLVFAQFNMLHSYQHGFEYGISCEVRIYFNKAIYNIQNSILWSTTSNFKETTSTFTII